FSIRLSTSIFLMRFFKSVSDMEAVRNYEERGLNSKILGSGFPTGRRLAVAGGPGQRKREAGTWRWGDGKQRIGHGPDGRAFRRRDGHKFRGLACHADSPIPWRWQGKFDWMSPWLGRACFPRGKKRAARSWRHGFP